MPIARASDSMAFAEAIMLAPSGSCRRCMGGEVKGGVGCTGTAAADLPGKRGRTSA
jgi:hypothetical protein